jgi:rhamnosyltransferase
MSVGNPPVRSKRTVAGIVAFHPDPSGLVRLIASVAADVARIILFANSPLDRAVSDQIAKSAPGTPTTFITPGENLGLGRAYNSIIELALREGAEFALLFDQDSMPSQGMVGRLEDLFDQLRRQNEKPAVVGPRPVKVNGEPFKIPRRRAQPTHLPATAVDFAISSGSLIALSAVKAVGPFDEEFFIDAIDIEWCSRAWKAGWSVWLGTDIPMTHRLGLGVIHLPFGLRMTDQPPQRLYTYFRNQVAMLRLAHVPAAWKLRFVASLPARCFIYSVRNRFAKPVVKAIGLGLVDGIMNRLGSPGRGWRAITGSRRPDGHRPARQAGSSAPSGSAE